jgi:hypothetical protein
VNRDTILATWVSVRETIENTPGGRRACKAGKSATVYVAMNDFHSLREVLGDVPEHMIKNKNALRVLSTEADGITGTRTLSTNPGAVNPPFFPFPV